LMDHARAFGADYLATGHYARVDQDAAGRFHLFRGVDGNKDQSYVLSVLNQELLARSLFPLGSLTKPEVRQRARDGGPTYRVFRYSSKARRSSASSASPKSWPRLP
jgi:tRNA-specific 2-thiouridylase